MSNMKVLCIAVIAALMATDLAIGGLLAGYGRGPAGGFGAGGFGGGGFGGGGGYGGYNGAYNGPPTPYNFQYAVRDAFSGNDFGQHESGDGAGNVKGEYQVLLPDGRNQLVTYTASDATGYVANVQYSGTPHYGGGGAGGFGGARGFGGAGGFGGAAAGGLVTGNYLPPHGK